MNVAIFASSFWPHLGGVEEHVRQFARHALHLGISPIVLTNRWPRSLPAQEVFEGITIHRLPMRVPEGGLKAIVNYRLTHGRICRQMLDILREHKTDLLHVHCVSSNGYYALIAQEHLRLPLVVTTHGERTMDATRLYESSPLMNRTLRTLTAKADRITACSRHTLDDLEEYYGTPLGNRASVVHNGIDPVEFASFRKDSLTGRPYVFAIGRLVEQKGFDVLITAFAKARIESHDLLIAGEGPERPALESLAKKLQIEQRVQFTGRADRTQAVRLFANCQFFVLPSRIEPMGIVNLEAMVAGKAVVASDVGGVPEIVLDGETGLLVRAEDPSALAQAIERLAGNAQLRQQLGEAGRRRAGDFTWQKVTERYLQIYSEVTHRRPMACNGTPNPKPAETCSQSC